MKLQIVDSAKYERAYNRYTHVSEFVISNLLAALREEFDVADDLVIVIRPIRQSMGTVTRGQAVGQLEVQVDCRSRDVWQIAETIAHELTHAEQYKHNRLCWTWDIVSDKLMYSYDGQLHDKATSYDEYLDQPWEVEARARANDFVNKYKFEIANIEMRVGRINRRKK